MKLVLTVIYLIPLSILMGVFSIIRFLKRVVGKPIKDKINKDYS
ncbi:hypothetical protein [Flavobacterium undicola]|nr:hypothetical protein [Flavobacterium undicola]